MRCLLPLLALVAPAASLYAQDGGGVVEMPTDDITAQVRAAIHAEVAANRAALGLPDPLVAAKTAAPQAFTWPIALAPSVGDPGEAVVSAHFDHDPAAGATLDFFCGTRTYDGHEGTDIAGWPFPMLRMDTDELRAVAAAPGTIIGKRDGNFDRNCSAVAGAQWNAVYVQHDDGLVAWYGHLKNGSPTRKAVGERVARGEVLGTVGSSGRSTGPHLHFEVYAPGGVLQDPFAGACNRLNGQTTWWAAQKPVSNPRLNAIRTGGGPPTVRTCPDPETPNEKRAFAPGDPLVFSAYFQDQAAGETVSFRVFGPSGQPAAVMHWDGSVVSEWVDEMPSGGRGTYRYYTRSVMPNAPTGQWRVEARYRDQTVSRAFAVGEALPTADEAALADGAVGAVYPNPFGDTAALDAVLRPGEAVRVDAFDLLGRHAATLFDGVATGDETLRLDTRALARGAYTLRIVTPRGTLARLGVRR